MSGGCYDYISFKIDDFANSLEIKNKERAWFKKLLHLVAAAAHDVEWVDSGDKADGDELISLEAIKEFAKRGEPSLAEINAIEQKLIRIIREELADYGIS